MTSDPPDDDKCQVSTCCETHFTYCPHCKLFVCIEHLNEHHANYKQEYQVLLNDGKQQQILNKQFIDDIEKEKQQLLSFFHREIEYYQTNDNYFHEKSIQSAIRPQDCADLRSHILQSSQKRLQFKKFIHQIQQLINDYEYHQPNGTTDEACSPLVRVKNEEIGNKPRISKSSPLAQFSIDYEEIDDDDDENDAEEELNNHSHDKNDQVEKSTITNGKHSNIIKSNHKEASTTDTKEASDEPGRSDDDPDEDDESDDDNPGSDPDFVGKRRTVNLNIRRKKDGPTPRPVVNHFQVSVCPLADKRYGIDLKKHPLRHVPCTRSNISSIYLFTHLRVFHCLSSKASLRLVRHIMYNGCERDYDLFSHAADSLVSVLPKSYRGRCPLTRLGAFGLTKHHDIRLCQENQTHENTGLLNHFVVYHCLSYPWANKLCNAIQAGDADGSKQALFKPNEAIKAKKWLTTQGKLILAKRHSSVRKRKKKLPTIKAKKK